MLIIERIKESLKRQDWTAVSLELVIVIIGVFIGTQVSNWNQERIDRRETARMLQELRPALEDLGNGQAFSWLSWVGPLLVCEMVMQWGDGARKVSRGNRPI